ncbi:hypothetical protein [Rhodococcus sp. Chr-9]|jgi:hypothetical protein|uniref:hypothetical protein n=1 Tax=Rhodococcus sp. Chr-9 TaxID=713612 RepID=UPI00126A3B73|nr:hypothetical protein [Rhodococcus sp. Chr-9]
MSVREVGWSYKAWTGSNPVVLVNLRVLGGTANGSTHDDDDTRERHSVRDDLDDLTVSVKRPGSRIAVSAKLMSGVGGGPDSAAVWTVAGDLDKENTVTTSSTYVQES